MDVEERLALMQEEIEGLIRLTTSLTDCVEMLTEIVVSNNITK